MQSEPSAYDTHQFLQVATALAAWGRIQPGDVVAAIATTWCEHVCWLATVATLTLESRSLVPLIHCDACYYTSIVSRTKTRVGLVRCLGTIACLFLSPCVVESDVCMRVLTYCLTISKDGRFIASLARFALRSHETSKSSVLWPHRRHFLIISGSSRTLWALCPSASFCLRAAALLCDRCNSC